MERSCHPLLRGGRNGNKYSHGFSRAEMESLASVCEAILPPLPLNSLQLTQKAAHTNNKASGSQNSVPEEVAELIEKRGFFEAVMLLRVVLTILSTRLGTFLLCGSLCLGDKWPFIYKFSQISQEKREKVDENQENPAWEALGYQVDTTQNLPEDKKKRPLQKGLVETINENDSTLVHSLTQKGLKVTEDPKQNLYRVQCDAVIVGSGCGGGVAAAVLASSGLKVVVLEKGNYFHSTDYSLLEGPSMNQLYEGGGIFSTLDGKMMLLAGSTVVGGGSAVNWSACIRTPKIVLQEWAQEHKLSLFESPQYLSAVDTVWERIGVTEKCLEQGFQNQILQKGCEKLGLDVETVARNSSENHYCGSCCFGCRTGNKQGTDSTWLVDAVDHGESNGLSMRFPIDSSPNDLKWPKKQTHWAQPTSPPGSHGVGYFPESNSEFKGKVTDGGIITSVHKVVSEEFNVRALVETPALAPGQYAALCPWESGLDIKSRILKYSRTALLFSMIRDRGSGEVKGEGRVSYKFDKLDKENMKAGLRRVLEILVAAGAVEVGTHRSDGQRIKCQGISKEELDEFLDAVCAKSWAEIYGGKLDDLLLCPSNGEFAVGVNPMVTIQSTAYCLSKKIAQSLAKK
ncbi:fatty alcohol oxidase 3 [Actinidia rufa]|uniref:Long-chain-alcohol oxidase n=1 Tax=Actinidia rufa TaxID=165716 RepID=A0A7J0F3Y3_9ERIC|nr:fatty alcohol oxidase 3 [Actinidia rufa]